MSGVGQCPNGCGELEVAYGHIYTNDSNSYFKVNVQYCTKCCYIGEVDADW
jgi:hypothetical protein